MAAKKPIAKKTVVGSNLGSGATEADAVSLLPADATTPRPRLHKLVVRNFRSIGPEPVAVELDDVVVLVGPNNAGKSSILRAYEIVMRQGSAEGKLQVEDFPNNKPDEAQLPEIELQTVIFEKLPAGKWLAPHGNGEWLIREKWTWSAPKKEPVRRGFDVESGDWVDQVPWGAPNVANSRRPVPHRIEAFASPEKQAEEIVALLAGELQSKVKSHRSGGAAQEKSDYELLIVRIAEFQRNVAEAAEAEKAKIENEVSALIERVFPKHRIKLDARPETEIEKAYTPFKVAPDMVIGPVDGYQSTVAQQGSGARRTLLWTALKYISDATSKEAATSRPHVLLLDEPEICLHPAAIREAREVLYNLPSAGNWQVLITTHSPVFIDLSKDNTTVVRVARKESGAVQSTTLYRPLTAKLDADDKANLKALNACDPYVNEFFFGGPVLVVEGDTEYTAFSYLRSLNLVKYRDIHIVRARGKGAILSILKILNQFSTPYSVLHDCDRPTGAKGKNPMWTVNQSIRDAIASSPIASDVVHVLSVPNFEMAAFGSEVGSDKPYNALRRLEEEEDARTRVQAVLDVLLGADSALPPRFERWKSLDELAAKVGEI